MIAAADAGADAAEYAAYSDLAEEDSTDSTTVADAGADGVAGKN